MTEQFDKCIDLCHAILEVESDNKEILKLRNDSINGKKNKERDNRRKDATFKKQLKQDEMLLNEIKNRNIKIDSTNGSLALQDLEVHFPALVDSKVHLDEKNNLVWPVVFLYPEYQTMDFVQSFPENDL